MKKRKNKAENRLLNTGWVKNDDGLYTKGDDVNVSFDSACRIENIRNFCENQTDRINKEKHLLANGWVKANFKHVNEKLVRVTAHTDIRVVTSTHDVWKIQRSDDPTLSRYYYANLNKAYREQLKMDSKNVLQSVE